jgi:hypothetical protein
MKTISYYWARLAAGLIAVALAMACSAVLDTESLGPGPGSDAVEDAATGDQEPLPDILPGDLGFCKAGANCTVVGQKGACAVGKSVCFEAGTGTCVQTVNPTTETCDGKDTDCDGTKDSADAQAHASCGQGKYCAGSSCADGCWSNSGCWPRNPNCIDHKCMCDADSKCNSGETCKSGVCYCGSKAGPEAGPACPNANCDPDTSTCGAPPPDLGPDKAVPDQKVPDQKVPDQKVPDQNVPDQGQPDLPQPDTTVDTTSSAE